MQQEPTRREESTLPVLTAGGLSSDDEDRRTTNDNAEERQSQLLLQTTIDYLSGDYVLFASLIWPLIICIICFTLFALYNWSETDDENYGVTQIPTISMAGAYSPANQLFTAGLHLEAPMLAIIYYSIYTHYATKINEWHRAHFDDTKNANRLHGWNRKALWLGELACALMFVVGSVSLATEMYTHAAFAFFMFLFAVLHMCLCFYILGRDIPISEEQARTMKLCIFLCVPFNVIMIFVAALVFSSCKTSDCRNIAAQMGPCLEIVTTASLMVYLYSYRDVLRKVRCQVGVYSYPPPSSSGVEISPFPLSPPTAGSNASSLPAQPMERNHTPVGNTSPAAVNVCITGDASTTSRSNDSMESGAGGIGSDRSSLLIGVREQVFSSEDDEEDDDDDSRDNGGGSAGGGVGGGGGTSKEARSFRKGRKSIHEEV